MSGLQPTLFAHGAFMQMVMGLLFTVVAWFVVRTLRKIDANQTELFHRLNDLSKDFYEMRGEHNVNHGGQRRR